MDRQRCEVLWFETLLWKKVAYLGCDMLAFIFLDRKRGGYTYESET